MKTIKLSIFRPHELKDEAAKRDAIEVARKCLVECDIISEILLKKFQEHLRSIGIVADDIFFDYKSTSMNLEYVSVREIKLVNSKKFLSKFLSHADFKELEKINPTFDKIKIKQKGDYYLYISDRELQSNRKYMSGLDDKVQNIADEFRFRTELLPIFEKVVKQQTSDESVMEFAKNAPEELLWFFEDGREVNPALLGG